MDRAGNGRSQSHASACAHLHRWPRREGCARARAIADHLGVTQPTAMDSIAAMIQKGLLKKAADTNDARAVAIRITPAGRDIVRGIGLAITSTERALETLSASEQTALLLLVIKTIRALQVAGAISPQRMCVTCRHFRHYSHDDARTPHHCAFVDAASALCSIAGSTKRSRQSTAKSHGENMHGKPPSPRTRCAMRHDNTRASRAPRAMKTRREARACRLSPTSH